MKPEGARYEHDDRAGCTCIFLGTFQTQDLWCHPVEGGSFDMVMAQCEDNAFCVWAMTWETAVVEIYVGLKIAYNLARQRGLTPLNEGAIHALVGMH